jgi:hypothetical protein
MSLASSCRTAAIIILIAVAVVVTVVVVVGQVAIAITLNQERLLVCIGVLVGGLHLSQLDGVPVLVWTPLFLLYEPTLAFWAVASGKCMPMTRRDAT